MDLVGGGGGCDMGNTGKVREKVENGVDDHDADGGPVSRNPFCIYVASSVEVRRGDQHTYCRVSDSIWQYTLTASYAASTVRTAVRPHLFRPPLVVISASDSLTVRASAFLPTPKRTNEQPQPSSTYVP